MKKILLPTDFSENAWNAITYALHLYKNEKCNFILLHTYTPIFYQLEYMEPSTRAFQVSEAVKETAQKDLDDVHKKIMEAFPNTKHVFTKILAFNTLTEEINELADRSVMDMIIMGSKGASGIKGVLFGSNTVHVLKKLKCPVIVVPDEFEYEKPQDILFPTDYNIDFQSHHLKPILEIINLHHSRLNILHVLDDKVLSEDQKKNKTGLLKHLDHVAPLIHEKRKENLSEAIDKLQLKMGANMLVLVNNEHSFFENLLFTSHVNQIGFHLNIPFLVMPSKN